MSTSNDDVERRQEKARKSAAIRNSMNSTAIRKTCAVGGPAFETATGFGRSPQNTPSLKSHHAILEDLPGNFFETSSNLWIVDRILEFQSLTQFLLVCLREIPLPGEESLDESIPEDSAEDVLLLLQPYQNWAPAQFTTKESAAWVEMVQVVNSGDRIQYITKELQAMKALVWEGIAPLSARQWRERDLYHPTKFSEACQILSLVNTVFHYLNFPLVQRKMRESFLLIAAALKPFEQALNLKRSLEGKPAIDMSSLWCRFIRAKFAVMVDKAHSWVMGHVDQMRRLIISDLETFSDRRSGLEPLLVGVSEVIPEGARVSRAELLNKWQDVTDIASHADFAILLPLDGYDGSPVAPTLSEAYTSDQPLRISPFLEQRRFEYHTRRKHLFHDGMSGMLAKRLVNGLGSSDQQSSGRDVETLRLQESTQQTARLELRGEPTRYKSEPWLAIIRKIEAWGFVIYRAYHSCTEAEWDNFRAEFDKDQADWGSEIAGVEALRQRSKLHWLDARDLGIRDGDIEALKSTFNVFKSSNEFPSGVFKNMFLVVDQIAVLSHLDSSVDSLKQGIPKGSVFLVDAEFDPAEGPDRPEETPMYKGSFRILTSLLWDNLSAQIVCRCQALEKLWPLAMNQLSDVYRGSAVPVRLDPEF